MKAVGFITEKAKTQFIPEDLLIAEALRPLGISVYPIPWDDSDSSALNKVEMAIFRTPWNYYRELPRFKEWLRKLDSVQIPIHNPLSVIRWNLDKHYLQELASKEVPVIPTSFFKTEDFKVDMLWPNSPIGRFVLKPVISATAHRTFMGDRVLLTDILVEESFYGPQETLMLQPFVENIVSEGEHSLLFFNGEYSHAVLKKPKFNDFRVQEEHGGSWDYVVPTEELLIAARSALSAIGKPLLYARVDLVRFESGFRVMELELLEPMLYIKTPELAQRFAQAIASRL